MDLTDLKEKKQRAALLKIAAVFNDLALQGDAEDVEIYLSQLQAGFLEPLGEDDFFGTEGWAYYFGFED